MHNLNGLNDFTRLGSEKAGSTNQSVTKAMSLDARRSQHPGVEHGNVQNQNMDIFYTKRAKTEAFETWCWGKALIITRRRKTRSEEVLCRADTHQSIWNALKENTKKRIGRLIRNNAVGNGNNS
ncbi:Hypothetical protein CINCED_3A025368 [Cinara cedri]|uniref:Uncharacterized protein n=1 Tax=Cinara cedri TaxID=506608 RepID=A0A5E4LYB6_9HEMI|nr:Hypothetical protein CINCED_3A025368 [Cinara cedri]